MFFLFRASSVVCDHIEIAEKGRRCEVCHLSNEPDEEICSSCSSILANIQEIQGARGYGSSLVHVLTSLQRWAKDLPAWELIRGMDLLTKPVKQRFPRPTQQRLAPFIVMEGPDSVGKTFHIEGISLWLTKQGFAVQGLTFPNNQTPLLGRFLKRALREQIALSTWTHHVLFSLHRWEFSPWIVDMLSKNYAVIVERYAWSGTAYSWASDPVQDPHSYMVLDAGLPHPDLVICIETAFVEVMQRGGIAPSLFVDIDFRQSLRTCYADPRIWTGINVLVHETQMNRWASRKSLIRRIQGEPLLRAQPTLRVRRCI